METTLKIFRSKRSPPPVSWRPAVSKAYAGMDPRTCFCEPKGRAFLQSAALEFHRPPPLGRCPWSGLPAHLSESTEKIRSGVKYVTGRLPSGDYRDAVQNRGGEYVAIRSFDGGGPIFWSRRIGMVRNSRELCDSRLGSLAGLTPLACRLSLTRPSLVQRAARRDRAWYLTCCKRQGGNLHAAAGEENVGSDEEGVGRQLCCSGVLVGTNRMFGLVTASQIASASVASFFCRLT